MSSRTSMESHGNFRSPGIRGVFREMHGPRAGEASSSRPLPRQLMHDSWHGFVLAARMVRLSVMALYTYLSPALLTIWHTVPHHSNYCTAGRAELEVESRRNGSAACT